MSTTAIQTQLGYAAQASPLASAHSVAATPIVEKSLTPAAQEQTHQETRHQDVKADDAAQSAPQRASSSSSSQSVSTEPKERTVWRTELDWRTSEVVYRVIDSRNGEVVSQLPDEALLRLRAYAKQAQAQNEFEPMNVPSLSRDT